MRLPSWLKRTKPEQSEQDKRWEQAVGQWAQVDPDEAERKAYKIRHQGPRG